MADLVLPGVWHNFVLCLAALGLLFLLPLLLFPVYSTGGGALVTEVVQVSISIDHTATMSMVPPLSLMKSSLGNVHNTEYILEWIQLLSNPMRAKN